MSTRTLEKYQWPGNIRQLHNVISRAIILSTNDKISDDQILLEDESAEDLSNLTLKEHEEQILLKRLKEFQGNKTRTAESLGVSVRWIQKKMKEIEARN